MWISADIYNIMLNSAFTWDASDAGPGFSRVTSRVRTKTVSDDMHAAEGRARDWPKLFDHLANLTADDSGVGRAQEVVRDVTCSLVPVYHDDIDSLP